MDPPRTRDVSWFREWDNAVNRMKKYPHTATIGHGEGRHYGWRKLVQMDLTSGKYTVRLQIHGVLQAIANFACEDDLLREVPRWLYQDILPTEFA